MNKKENNRGRKPKATIASKVMKFSNGEGFEKYNFMYNIVINQYAVVKNEWELDIIDIGVFYAISHFINYGKPEFVTDLLGKRWYWVDENKIIKEMPLLPLSSKIAVSKRIDNLIKCDLIERKPDNKSTGKKMIRVGDNAEKLFFTKPNQD